MKYSTSKIVLLNVIVTSAMSTYLPKTDTAHFGKMRSLLQRKCNWRRASLVWLEKMQKKLRKPPCFISCCMRTTSSLANSNSHQPKNFDWSWGGKAHARKAVNPIARGSTYRSRPCPDRYLSSVDFPVPRCRFPGNQSSKTNELRSRRIRSERRSCITSARD